MGESALAVTLYSFAAVALLGLIAYALLALLAPAHRHVSTTLATPLLVLGGLGIVVVVAGVALLMVVGGMG
jgi:hypothetical protein